MSAIEGVGFSNSASIPDDLFLLNPFHQKMVTGRSNYRYAWHRFGCSGVFLVGFLIFMIGITIPSFLTEYRLATMKTGQTKGQVIDHRISRGKSTTYYVTYQYTANSQTYTQEDSVSNDNYYNYEIGSNIPVTYLASDPNTAHIGENSIHWNAMIPLAIIGGFFVIFGIIWLVSQLPEYRRFRRMKREGQLILGQLKGSRGELVRRGSGKSRRTDYDVSIVYEFMTPDGKKIDNAKTFTRNDLKKKELPTNGTVAVLYVADNDYVVL